MSHYGWSPYVPVAERRRKAAKAMEKLAKKGHPVSPVLIEGRTIARTFWGKAWCENLEGYSDYANRLPRGRTYVRNGSVLDLQITPGLVEAQVSGSSIYQVRVKVKGIPGPTWRSLCEDCGGAIESLVELLQGRFSKAVMARICRQGAGLFPAPGDIAFSCSCPDGASMCKHVAAVLYGIGARLDADPELLFRLRDVTGAELLAHATTGLGTPPPQPAVDRVLSGDDLSELFGLEMDAAPVASEAVKAGKARAATPIEAKSKPSKPKPAKVKAARVGNAKSKSVKPAAKPKPKPKPRPRPKPKTNPKGGIIN